MLRDTGQAANSRPGYSCLVTQQSTLNPFCQFLTNLLSTYRSIQEGNQMSSYPVFRTDLLTHSTLLDVTWSYLGHGLCASDHFSTPTPCSCFNAAKLN